MPFDTILFFVIIYGVGSAVLVFLTHVLREAGNSAGGQGVRTASRLVMALWLWAGIANTYALVVVGDDFLWFVPAVALPILMGFAVTFIEPVRHVLRHISLPKLIIVQVYRNAGAVFLIAYYVTGTYMSKEFADNAGWGDVLTGMLAIPTALAALYRVPFWRLAVIVWCALGIGDLILAPVTAQIYGGMRSDDFPINAIPIFFGPPLGILLHLVAMRALVLQRETQGPRDGLKASLARPEAAA